MFPAIMGISARARPFRPHRLPSAGGFPEWADASSEALETSPAGVAVGEGRPLRYPPAEWTIFDARYFNHYPNAQPRAPS
jgi:hypothetical protein